MKKIPATIIIFFIIINVNALQDSYLFVDSQDTGICLSVDGLTDIACNGTALRLEGTDDHILYITPEIEVQKTDNKTAILTYSIENSIDMIMAVAGVLIILLFFFTVLYAISTILRNI